MITLVCVYNNEKILNEYLLKSLKDQTAKFELIKIDNTAGRFKSAAEALNLASKETKGKYLMFVHQDVDLSSQTWLEDVEKILDSIHDLGIAGVAGVSEQGNSPKERGKNIIKHGYPPTDTVGSPIQRPERVQTLDECLVIIPRVVFDVLQFDDNICNDWHLYATDYCLSVRKLGFYPYAIPMFIYHRSKGYSMSAAYYQTLKKILKKHKNQVKYIYKPAKAWSTSSPLILQRSMLLAKQILRYFLIGIGIRYLWRKSGLKSLLRKK